MLRCYYYITYCFLFTAAGASKRGNKEHEAVVWRPGELPIAVGRTGWKRQVVILQYGGFRVPWTHHTVSDGGRKHAQRHDSSKS